MELVHTSITENGTGGGFNGTGSGLGGGMQTGYSDASSNFWT